MKSNNIKKAFIFGLILLLLGSGFVSGYTGNNSFSLKSKKIDYFFDDECPTMTPVPIDLNKEPNYFDIELIDTPEQFNWKNFEGKDWTTPARNQKNCGSCWLFSAMGALESIINIKEECADLDPDLSEQYVLSCLPDAGSCNGGNVEKCVFYFIKNTSSNGNYCNGVVLESCLGYLANDDIPCNDKCENWEDFLVPILDYGESWSYYNIPELKDTIKSLIYQKGPIMVYFWASRRFIGWGRFHKLPSQYYPDYNENCPNFVNHGITVIGWKDDPSIGNGGYWICKNTWGPKWGYNGFFNIEYDILNLGGFIAWVDYDPKSFDWGPTAPVINGPKNGEPEKEYELIFTSMDPDGDDDVYYYIDWGDGLKEEWIGPYKSGESLEIKHIWENEENYDIRAKAKDTMGRESNWATHKFQMSKNKQLFMNPVFKFLKIIVNHFFQKNLLIYNGR